MINFLQAGAYLNRTIMEYPSWIQAGAYIFRTIIECSGFLTAIAYLCRTIMEKSSLVQAGVCLYSNTLEYPAFYKWALTYAAPLWNSQEFTSGRLHTPHYCGIVKLFRTGAFFYRTIVQSFTTGENLHRITVE